MKQKLKIGLTIAALGFTGNTFAFTTDGDLNDWLADGGSWAANNDSSIGIDKTALGGQFGGHNYDAERLLASVAWGQTALDHRLHVAIISGVPPDQGIDSLYDEGIGGWRPGDLAIYTGTNHTYSQLWDVNDRSGNNPIHWKRRQAPDFCSPNCDGYDLDSATTTNPNVYGAYIPDERDSAGTLDTDSGLTGDTDLDGNTGYNDPEKRKVVQGARWFTNARGGSQPKMVASMYENQGSDKGQADVVYTEAKYNGANFRPDGKQHYIIEMAISLTSLGWTQGQTTFNDALQWGMNCSNDWINGHGSWAKPGPGGGQPVPEPAALALMALGLIGVGYGRRRTQANS